MAGKSGPYPNSQKTEISSGTLGYPFSIRRKILGEGAWVLSGQGLSAVGVLIATRIQTEYIEPSIFAKIILLQGLGLLAVGTLCSPLLQAAIRLYPEAVLRGNLSLLRSLVAKLLVRNLSYVTVPALVLGLFYAALTRTDYWEIVLLCGLILIDTARSFEMAWLNAGRQQKSYALWSVFEACLRPAFAVLLVVYMGATTRVVLAGYLLASFLNVIIFGARIRKDWRPLTPEDEVEGALRQEIKSYAKPLFPLSIVGWIASVSDRYIVAGLIGMADAGLYSVTYGLISRPFLVAHNAFEPHRTSRIFRQGCQGRPGRSGHTVSPLVAS